ncbi:DNA/RNA non-specific endonuclease [Streptomyces sp. NPDC002888]|uniref:DNA/RNA non-specific endonuclease n=1 Tax=Streptomyces sp. NPDC002888 TaxID=3364668 RepID=UPI0036CD441A
MRQRTPAYQSLDGAGRAQGATALICPSDLKPPLADRDTGSVNVYGFPDPAQNKTKTGGTIFDRTHTVGDKVGGDWVNENLFTGFSRMNKSGMRRCEIKMEKQLAAGKWVMYTGKANYSHTSWSRTARIGRRHVEGRTAGGRASVDDTVACAWWAQRGLGCP